MEDCNRSEEYLSEIRKNMSEAIRVWQVGSVDTTARQHPKWLFSFFKKVLYRLIRWAVLPNWNQQAHFNGKMINAVGTTEIYLRESLPRWEETIRHLEAKLDEQKTVLMPQLESQRKQIALLEKKVALLKKENDEFLIMLKKDSAEFPETDK